MSSFQLLTPPTVEPITLAEAKTHLRVDTTADDDLIAALIVAARQFAEAYTGRAFIHQTWRICLDEAPTQNLLMLPKAPLVSVTKIESFDDTDTAQPWNENQYFVDTASEPGRLVLRTGSSWPTPTRAANGIVIDYVAGYGATTEDVPLALRLAIRQLVSFWYENRGESGDIPLIVPSLLQAFRIQRLGVS